MLSREACEAWIGSNVLLVAGMYLTAIFVWLAAKRLLRARRRCEYAAATGWFLAVEAGLALAMYASNLLMPILYACREVL